MSVKQLDLSSYHEPVSNADIAPYIREALRPDVGKIFVLVVSIAMYGLVVMTALSAGAQPLTYFLLVIIPLAVIAIGVAILKARAIHRVRLSRMAERNGVEVMFDVKEPVLNGMYFQAGYDRKLIESIHMVDDGISLGIHQYVTGSGKNRQTHMVGFASRTLTRNLPHMVLDNTKNNFWKLSNLPVQYKNDQKLSLEGDFNNFFTLYAPKQYERDALYIFTPDVMAAFVDSGYTIDAEIVDNTLWLYCENSPRLTNEDFVNKMYSMIQSIGGELESQSDMYRDERVVNPTANVVAPAGKRLKTSYSYITLVVIGVYIFVQMLNSYRPDGTGLNMPFMATILLVTIFVTLMVVGRRK